MKDVVCSLELLLPLPLLLLLPAVASAESHYENPAYFATPINAEGANTG